MSKRFSKLFPEIDQQVTEQINDEKNEIDMENWADVLCKIGDDEKPFEFVFFTGGENKKFNDIMRSYGLSTNNLEFLDFLQSEICKKISATNKVKFMLKLVISTMIIMIQANQFLIFF